MEVKDGNRRNGAPPSGQQTSPTSLQLIKPSPEGSSLIVHREHPPPSIIQGSPSGQMLVFLPHGPNLPLHVRVASPGPGWMSTHRAQSSDRSHSLPCHPVKLARGSCPHHQASTHRTQGQALSNPELSPSVSSGGTQGKTVGGRLPPV